MPFYRNDLIPPQRVDDLFDTIAQRRAAGLTSRVFCVKPPVAWISVLGFAVRAHSKIRHCRVRPVIRNLPSDGVARSAIRAVREGVAEAAIARIPHFRQAIGADRLLPLNRLREFGGGMLRALQLNHDASPVL